MPELPEVEVIRCTLLPQVAGRRVYRVICSNKRLRLPLPRKRLHDLVAGFRIGTIDRRGKHLLFSMTSGATLGVHLGMSGRLTLVNNNAPRCKHDHVRLMLEHGLELRFNDSRRFGSLRVCLPGESPEEIWFADLGPEPLSPDFNLAYLLQKARDRRRPVKNFLMDSRVVAGIGNIYANEILFAAGVHPATPAGELSEPQWQRVLAAAAAVLAKAISCGGTTIADFVDGSGASGYFQLELEVYGRQGRPCRRCGAIIERAVHAGRATFHCPGCQR